MTQAVYVVGDIQGCATELNRLLALTEADTPGARYLFAGDLINRGPESLQALRTIRTLQQEGRAEAVLGNHDLHFLAVAQGLRPPHRQDTLNDLLNAPDLPELMLWLRQRPLAWSEAGWLIVHAGLYPQWDAATTLALAAEVSAMLQAPDWLDFMAQMYGNQPDRWDDNLQGHARWRCIINALTRMRYCSAGGQMDFALKEGTANAPEGLMPWFAAERASANDKIAFGHWSTLGLIVRDNLLSLDTGCVWGGKLTAVRLQDLQVFQIDCPQQQRPGA